jgi:hypothetical protein
MKKDFYLTEVCERLAGDLVREQATLLKHEAIVKDIKAKLVEGKQQLIKQLILGKVFDYKDQKMTALCVDFGELKDNMLVEVTMGMSPEYYIQNCALTKREKLLIDDYESLCEHCREEADDYFGNEARETAYELMRLKNGVWLIRTYSWEVDFSNAGSTDFFKESGLVVHEEGISYLLEEMETFIL